MEYKQAIIVRTDLGMGKGKIAAQASHASVSAADKSPHTSLWKMQGQKKIVLKIAGERELVTLFQDAKDQGLPAALIEDAGHTQIAPGTKTCVGIGPAPEEDIDELIGELKLL
ncbi:peptidyl-tRNA hydrolase Pth2 [Candidatus Altiarchaeota archaeon]